MTEPLQFLSRNDHEFAARIIHHWVHGTGRNNSGNLESRRVSASTAENFILGQDFYQVRINAWYTAKENHETRPGNSE